MMARCSDSSLLNVLLVVLLSVVANAASVSVPPVLNKLTSSDTHESCSELATFEARIRRFLEERKASKYTFHVQGWRWHTLSLARDARRLGDLASRLRNGPRSDKQQLLLEKGVNHVIRFNMKALHRIEDTLFFPWLREKLSSVEDADLAEAFGAVLDEVVHRRDTCSQLGLEVSKHAETATSSTATDAERMEALDRIAETSAELASSVMDTLSLEDSFLVPGIAVLVPTSQQRSFNNNVIRSLGVRDGRLHLVGMHEAVLEQDKKEQSLFQEEIPAIPRYMIPRWKRLLYDPQASVLESPQ